MPIFPEVIARLREDDSILGMDDIEYLEVYFAFDGWPETRRDLLPDQWLRFVVRFVKRLDENAARVADRPYVPDMRNPNRRYELKADDDLIVAFHDRRPTWYWERKEEIWNLHALWAIRSLGGGSFVEVGQDMAHRWIGEDRLAGPPDAENTELLDALLAIRNLGGDNFVEDGQDMLHDRIDEDRPAGLPDAEDPECLDPRDAEIHACNDPARLLADPLLGVLSHFWRVLKDGLAQLEGTPYLLLPGQPNSPCRYRSNDEFVVAYWPVGNGEYEPAWCWKRKPDGAWKLYMLLCHPTWEIADDYALRELGEGKWD